MDGPWLFRADPPATGVRRASSATRRRRAGRRSTVPNAWNAKDYSDASFAGGVGWYRKDFHLPTPPSALSWVVRFESVNYRSRVYLNGQPDRQQHAAPTCRSRSACPPAAQARRRRTSSSSASTTAASRPTSRPRACRRTGVPTGGWWNYGGILREVYLRKIDRIDFTPSASCPTCRAAPATRTSPTRRRSATTADTAQRVRSPRAWARASVELGTRGGRRQEVRDVHQAHRGQATRRLWSPDCPYLYDTSLERARRASTRCRPTRCARGIRSIKVVDGHLMLNGKPLHFRGFGTHEDSLDKGFAIDDAQREQQIQWAREAGATLFRTPLPAAPVLLRAPGRARACWPGPRSRSTRSRPSTSSSALVRQLAAKELASAVRDQHQPPVDHRVVGRQRAQRAARARCRATTSSARSSSPSRWTRRGPSASPSPATRRPAASPSTRRWTCIGINEYFGWYSGPTARSPTATRCSATTSTASARATRTRRS